MIDGFRFSEEEWSEVIREWPEVYNETAARWDIETSCWMFARRRGLLKGRKGLPTPDRARKAWLDVAEAARKLKLAIGNLADAGAADLGFIDATEWASELPSFEKRAKWAADMERTWRKKPANNADPDRDWLVESLVRIWRTYTGHAVSENDGPLMRYLLAVTEPAFEAAKMKEPTVDMLRGVLRKAAVSSVPD